MKADPKMASQTANISSSAVCMIFTFVSSVCTGLLRLQLEAEP